MNYLPRNKDGGDGGACKSVFPDGIHIGGEADTGEGIAACFQCE